MMYMACIPMYIFHLARSIRKENPVTLLFFSFSTSFSANQFPHASALKEFSFIGDFIGDE